uniref:Outer membrane lipoprotein-sorting protein n=1 Tax=Ignavibacterium album TaxID=591197 RepID=A0A7V2ZMR9_9BACT
MKIKFIILSVLFIGILFINGYSQEESAESVEQAKSVIAKYLDATGGVDAIKNIQDKTVIMRGTAMDQTVTIVIKQKLPNKLRQDIKAGGMDQVLIFDGEKAVMKVAGQTIKVEGKQLEQLKLESTMELLLNPESLGIKISYDGTEKSGEDLLHKVKFVLPSGLKWVVYFDDKTGYKVKESKETETQMGLITQIVEYSDYQDVDGIKIPFKMKQSFGPQSIEMTISSVKINKGIPDDTFVISE